MQHVTENLVLGLIWGIEAIACAAALILIPRDILRSLKTGLVHLNGRPVRRLSNAIVYWLILIAGALFWA